MKRSSFETLALVLALGLAGTACDTGTDPGANGNGNGNGNGDTSASIGGAVTASGRPMSGVSIAMEGGETKVTAPDGAYTFPGLAAGTYTLVLTAPPGLQARSGESLTRQVTVTAAQSRTEDWTLDEPEPVIVDVTLAGVSFTPSDLTIDAGTTVRWVVDNGGHTITPNTADQRGVWANIQSANQGETYFHRFNVAGQEYDYFCAPHQSEGMVGQVTVN
jgi:plastocyanin